MISDIERGFNYTLTRDKLAMNLGSPPRRTKNVVAPAYAAPATSSTANAAPAPPTPKQQKQRQEAPSTPPSSHPPRHESRPDSDIRVASLEAQVAHLTSKGVEAADRLADYEEEIRNLKTLANPRVDSPLGIMAATPAQQASSLSRNSSIASGKFSFLTRTSSLTTASKPLPVKPSAQKSSPMAPSPSSSALADLQSALANETKARIAADKKYKDLEQELEDLSATLFEQANDMVAKERKEKAKLEERIKELEERDVLSRKRLEMVEGALSRIERVRKLLGQEG